MLNKMNLNEEWREYVMGNTVYRIDNPVTLYFRTGGSTHRVVDSSGIVHCLPGPGYHETAIRWKSNDPDTPVHF